MTFFFSLFAFLCVFISFCLHHIHTRNLLPSMAGIKALWNDKWWLARCVFVVVTPAFTISASLTHMKVSTDEAHAACKAVPGQEIRIIDGAGYCVDVAQYDAAKTLLKESKR